MSRILLIPALSTLAWASLLQAEEVKAEAIRSLVTSPAALTDVGALELELGGCQSYSKDDSQTGGITTQFNLGLTSWLDLRFGWAPHAWNRSADGQNNHGSGDPCIGGQALFINQEKAGVDIGLIYSHRLPRASVAKGLSSGYHADTLLVALSRSMGPWALDLNAGVNRTKVEDGSRKVNQKAGSLAITYAPAPGWNVSLDTYGTAKSDLGERQLSSILGASFGVNDHLVVDISIERGWAESSPRYGFNAGLVYRFGKLWGKK